MKVSISTTTYNREHLLPRTVNSVLSQTFADFEYWITNNGSTDNTQDLIDHYCREDKRVRSISYPVNRTDSKAQSERRQMRQEWILKHNPKYQPPPYCMTIDDDDFMEPNTLETLYRMITEYDADIASVGCKYVYQDGTTKDKFVFDGIYVFSRIEAMVEMLKREKFNVSMGGKLFRREILEIEDPKVKKIRDIHRGYRRMNRICRMVATGEPLYYFYRHDSNKSGLETEKQITPDRMRQHLEANTIRTEWLTKHMPEIKDFVFYCELSFMISMYERIYRLNVQSCFDIAQEMKDILTQNSVFLSECTFCTEREKEILKANKILTIL